MLVFPTLPGLTFTSVKSPEFNTLEQSGANGYEVDISQTANPIWHFTLIYDFLRDFPWAYFTMVSELRTLMGFFNAQQGKAGTFLYTDPDDNYVGPARSTQRWVKSSYFPLGFGVLDSSNHWQKVTAGTTFISGTTAPTFSTSGGSVTDGGLTWTDQGAYSASGFPNVPLAQLSLVNDGAGNYYSPVTRTLDGGGYEDVTDLNGAIAVYANGVLCSAGTGAGQYTLLGPGLALDGFSCMGMYLKWGSGTPPTAPITAQFNYYFRVKFETDSLDFEKFTKTGNAAAVAGMGGGFWTIGGSESQNGSGTLKLRTRRPVPPT